MACSGFPRCRNTSPIEKLDELKAKAEKEGTATPADGSAPPAKGRLLPTEIPKTPDGKIDFEALGPPPAGFAWTRTGKPVVETWPENELHCPECGHEMLLKPGRFGPFYSCTNFPKCRCSVNLRGEAKKRAEVEMPAPKKAKPIPTEVVCDECGEPMWIRTGRSGKFLGCSKYPKCKTTKPMPPELLSLAGKDESSA